LKIGKESHERVTDDSSRRARRFAPLACTNKVEATIVSGGGFFALKGLLRDGNSRRVTVWLHEYRSSVTSYGAAADRMAIHKLDGTVVA
jgi:hypothetical protein